MRIINPKQKNETETNKIIENFFLMTIVLNLEKDKIILVKKKVPENYLRLFDLPAIKEPIWILPCDFPKFGENKQIASERIGYEQSGYKVKFIEAIKDTLISVTIKPQDKEFFHSITLCQITSDEIDNNWNKPDNIEEIMWIKKTKYENYIPKEISNKWNSFVKYYLTV
ncbi:MAG: hypothetical protein KatS3mg095_0860 [Candidatus Parcubacteria bacterium]|nr:MAG: hypothetical protein KatS3mg095_0860 [Candidatus Parcubacteria bacterium]